MNDYVRASIRSFVESVIALVVIMEIFELGPVEIGALMLVVNNALTLIQLGFKQGQQAGTPA